jgi:RNA polymerase sigma factor (sigma-70 family)
MAMPPTSLKLNARQTRLFESHLELARERARVCMKQKRLPAYFSAQIHSAAQRGLARAARRYLAAAGGFEVYARILIWKAISDELRENDEHHRRAHKLRRGDVLPKKYNMSALETQHGDPREWPAPAVADRVADTDEVRHLLCAVRPGRDRRIVKMRYFFGWTQKEVATRLRLSESRVSQICLEAKRAMRMRGLR